MHFRSRSRGFTIIEVLMTLLFIGIIAILTIPGIIYKATDQDALFKSKNVAQMIQAAAVQYNQANPDTPPTSPTGAKVIGDMLNYTRADLNSVANTLVTNSPVANCNNGNNPCYKMADGGILIPNGWNDATRQGTFYYDPDGTDIRSGVTLILQYNRMVVVPLGATTGNAASDPDYIAPWSGN